MGGLCFGAMLNGAFGGMVQDWRLSEPGENPLSDPDSGRGNGSRGRQARGVLPEIFRGRMFCVIHGRQCYRRRMNGFEFVWVCPDERHVKPLK